jgi:hypothetical protein
LPRRHGQIVYPKNGDPLFLANAVAKGANHVQAPCSWSADFSIGTGCAFDGTDSGSNDKLTADLNYLHHVNDDKCEAHDNARQRPPIQYPGPPGFSAVGYMFRRLSLRR